MTPHDNDGFERPFRMEPAPELSRINDIPDWKKADFSVNWGRREEELPFRSSDFNFTHVDPEDWW